MEQFPYYLYLHFLIGNLGRFRRAFGQSTENGRAHTDMLATIMMRVSRIDDRTLNLEKKMDEQERSKKLKRFDISPYFPISSMVVLNDFLSNKDGNFTEKKEEFEKYLYSCCSLVMDMDNFSAGLLKTLFTKEFIRDHRWPSTE